MIIKIISRPTLQQISDTKSRVSTSTNQRIISISTIKNIASRNSIQTVVTHITPKPVIPILTI